MGTLTYKNAVSATASLNMGSAAQIGRSAFEARHILPDVALQMGVAYEAQSILSQNSGIVQALENTMNFASKLDSIGGSGILDRLDWMQNSGLAAALERDADYQSQIARTLDEMQSSFKDAVSCSGATGNISSAVMGLSSVIQNEIPNHSVIADICRAMSSGFELRESVPQVDKDILCDVADKVLSRPEEWTLDSAADAIAKEYDSEIEKQISNLQPGIKESLNVRESETVVPQAKKIDALMLGWIQNYKVSEFKHSPYRVIRRRQSR